jgi:hypothetical protein
MPSTTGMIESTHGHENARLPRFNKFWTALLRIIRSMEKKIYNTTSLANRNADRQTAIFRKRVKNVPSGEMEAECNYYNTIPPNQCECSETVLINSMFQMTFKCSHLLSMNADAPIPNMPRIILDISPSKLLVHFHQANKSIERPLPNQLDRKIEKIADIIRKYSHSKKRKDIVDWVALKYQVSNQFLSGYPLDFINLVSIAIDLFSK